MDEGNEAIFEYPRFQVSIVGFMATWWMGIPIATVLGLFSLHSDRKFMIEIAMKAFLVTMIIAFISGLYGLYIGFTYLADQPKENFGRWFIPDNLIDFRSFIAVGSMHNESYIGGLYGLFSGIAYIGWRKGMLKWRQKKSTGVWMGSLQQHVCVIAGAGVNLYFGCQTAFGEWDGFGVVGQNQSYLLHLPSNPATPHTSAL